MAFDSFYRTLLAICLTALIFATIVGVLCYIHRRESRQARQAETSTHVLPPPPSPYGINLPHLRTNHDFCDSDETLVAPAVSGLCVTNEHEEADHKTAARCTFISEATWTAHSRPVSCLNRRPMKHSRV